MEQYLLIEQNPETRQNVINTITYKLIAKKILMLIGNMLLRELIDIMIDRLPQKYYIIKNIWKFWYYYVWRVKNGYNGGLIMNMLILKLTNQTETELDGLFSNNLLCIETSILNYFYNNIKYYRNRIQE
jgi:hypothetical protein